MQLSYVRDFSRLGSGCDAAAVAALTVPRFLAVLPLEKGWK